MAWEQGFLEPHLAEETADRDCEQQAGGQRTAVLFALSHGQSAMPGGVGAQ